MDAILSFDLTWPPRVFGPVSYRRGATQLVLERRLGLYPRRREHEDEKEQDMLRLRIRYLPLSIFASAMTTVLIAAPVSFCRHGASTLRFRGSCCGCHGALRWRAFDDDGGPYFFRPRPPIAVLLAWSVGTRAATSPPSSWAIHRSVLGAQVTCPFLPPS
jgi:hypothetical protein